MIFCREPPQTRPGPSRTVVIPSGVPCFGALVQPTTDQITAFISKWSASKASERAHAQSFMRELCARLDVPEPAPRA